jgi:23S rRNA (cytidine2498-2'-O)-methyltransferase
MLRDVELATNYFFVLCQRGAEAALKRYVERHVPGLRPAYQRPGLLTFRSSTVVAPESVLEIPLARSFGMSLGIEPGLTEIVARIAELPGPLRLHVSECELFRPDEAPLSHHAGELARQTETALRVALPNTFRDGSRAERGELVLDVVVAPGDPILLGLHRHTSVHSPHPGGTYLYEVPDDAPSRAFRKIEEALIAFQLPVRAGDIALELGAAPGGTAYALLRRGIHVIGVDPAEMDAKVLAFVGPGGARLTHLPIPIGALERGMLAAGADWLFLDVHLAPQVALRAVSRIAAMYRRTLLGAILTLKLNEWAFVDQLPRFLEEARALGLLEPKARQLPAHRQELAIAGLSALGQKSRR